jgi:hypothetical protein
MKAMYARPIRVTASGTAIDRPTRVTALTVNAVDQDCIVNLRDGGSAGAIYWTVEADNASSSPTQSWNPGLNFLRNVYVEFVTKGNNSSACIAVIEP